MTTRRWACWTLAVLLVSATAVAERSKFNAVLSAGEAAPVWKDLPGIDGRTHSLADYRSRVLVLVFTSHRCPVARAYEERLLELSRRWKPEDVEIVALGVSRHPADGLDRVRAWAERRKVPFDCLADPSQATGKAYGVAVSLQVFVLDPQRRIAYLGAFDDSTDAAQVTRHYAVEAIESVLAGRQPAVKDSLPRGCEIEYAADARSR